MGDWSTDGVSIDSYSKEAATSNVQHMIRILDAAAKGNGKGEKGFDEQKCIDLYRYWLVVGSWMRTPDYAKIYGGSMQFLRAPRAIAKGMKYSTLLREALNRLAYTNDKDADSKHRRAAFDAAQERMLDFMYAFHTALAADSKTRAEAFRVKMQDIPQQVKTHYEKFWK